MTGKDMAELIRKANSGDSCAQYQVCSLYVEQLLGETDAHILFDGINENTIEEWLIKAAESDNVEAMYELFAFYMRNEDPHDRLEMVFDEGCEKAAYWLRKAAERNHIYAMYDWGFAHWYREYSEAEEYSECLKWYRRAADAGNVAAMRELGWVYWACWCGMKEKLPFDEAAKISIDWLRKASDKGSLIAQNILGKIYAGEMANGTDNNEGIDAYVNYDLSYLYSKQAVENKSLNMDNIVDQNESISRVAWLVRENLVSADR